MTLWHDPVGWWCALGRPLARLSRRGAGAALALLLLALAWAAFATVQLQQRDPAGLQAQSSEPDEGSGDLELYQRIHTRYQAGEPYYAVALDEQRRGNYPTRPFITVRLPTLAWIDGQLGPTGGKAITLALIAAIVLAWISALQSLASKNEVRGAVLLLFVAGIGLLDARALQFHELIAGGLLALALGLYRPSRWWPSLLLAALALAIRELALPFVLLWGLLAAFERQWKQVAGITLVIGLFALALMFHAQAVAQYVLPTDPASQGWTGFIGPQFALFSLTQLTALLFLPIAIAAPLALLALLGWIGLGGRLGLFATAWFFGWGLAMSLFAREANFYWVLVLLPTYGAGLAFVPRAIAELVRAALGRQTSPRLEK